MTTMADNELFGNSEQLESDHVADPGKMVGDSISRAGAIETVRKAKSIGQAHRMLMQLPSTQPGCEDAVSRADVDLLIEEAQTAWLKGDILLMYPALKKGLKKVPPVTPKQPGCEDAVPRTAVEYICRKNTVSTNPYEHKYHDKFIQFMDDPAISDFGRWQHSNGFNTALVAVECDLDKVPSITPKP